MSPRLDCYARDDDSKRELYRCPALERCRTPQQSLDDEKIEANAHALARYAALCQEASLLPVVEPEVLMDGEHTLARCGAVAEQVLRAVFTQLYAQDVSLEGMILKPNMVLPGLRCAQQEAVDVVADATVECLLRAVPAAMR